MLYLLLRSMARSGGKKIIQAPGGVRMQTTEDSCIYFKFTAGIL